MLFVTIQLRVIIYSRAIAFGGGSLIARQNSVTRLSFCCSSGEYDCVSWTSQGFGRGGEREGGSERARERECEQDRMMPQENKQREKEGETGRENQRVQQRQRGFWKVGGEQETGGSQKRKRE